MNFTGSPSETRCMMTIIGVFGLARRDLMVVRSRRFVASVLVFENASSGFIKQLGDASRGVIVTQVFPSERAMGQPMVKEATTLARAKGQMELSPAALEGFASAKVMVEALRRAGPKPTRAKVLAALDGLKNYDVGGLEVSYSPQDHSGIDFADLSIISEGRFKR